MGSLGRDPEFFRYVEGSVADRILLRTHYALTTLETHTNPYLTSILTGQYGTTLPRYLRPEHFDAIRGGLDRLKLFHGRIEQAAQQHCHSGFDGFNLSDLFEYLDPAACFSIYRTLVDCSRPGARLVYWNMLVPRKVPEALAQRVTSLDDEAAELFARDKASLQPPRDGNGLLMPTSSDIAAGCLLTPAFLVILAMAEAWRRWGDPDPEWTRKLIHLSGGAIALCIPYAIASHWVVLAMALAMTGLFAAGKAAGTLKSLHGVSRKSKGTEYYPLVIYLLFRLTPGQPWKYVICVLVLAVADSLAALIGSRYGYVHYELDENRKSLEGSLVFFVAAFLVVAVPLACWRDPAIPPLGNCLSAALLVAALSTGFEAIAQDGRDNLWVPLGTYVVLTKILRQPIEEIITQNAKLAVVCLVFGLLTWCTGALNVGGTLVFILAIYGCWSLTSVDWVLPAAWAFGAFLLVRSMGSYRPTFRSRTMVHWLLLPFLLVAAANYAWLRGDVAGYKALFGPYLAACATALAQTVSIQLRNIASNSRHRRLSSMILVAIVLGATVALPSWWMQSGVPYDAPIWIGVATTIAIVQAAFRQSGREEPTSSRGETWVQWAAIASAVLVVWCAQAAGLCPPWNPGLGSGATYSNPSGIVLDFVINRCWFV